jgi:hypothetical protein
MQSFYDTVHSGRVLDAVVIGKDHLTPLSFSPSQDEQLSHMSYLHHIL